MERKVFFGIGGYYVPGSGDSTKGPFKVVAHMYNGHKPDADDVTLQIDVDLTTRTPGTAASFADVRFDDRGVNFEGMPLAANAGDEGAPTTTIGDGKIDTKDFGALFIESRHFHAIKDKIYAPEKPDPKIQWPPAGIREHELATIAYSGDAKANPTKAGMRFVGMHASVLKRCGSLAKVWLHLHTEVKWRGPVWLDLDDLGDCDTGGADPMDPNDPLHAYPLINAGAPQGAVFVRMERLSALMNAATVARGPKLPIGEGG